MKIIKDLSDEKPFLIVYKHSGLPSAPISEDDKNNLFSKVAEIYPQILNVNGKKSIEHGLIHRLDTITSGLVVIAATQSCYDNLIELQKQNKIKKYYKAFCEYKPEISKILGGFPLLNQKFSESQNEYFLQSYFRYYEKGRKSVRPVTNECSKKIVQKVGKKVLYSTNIKIINKSKNKIQVEACITNGFKHQIRSHLCWLDLPIIADPLYNQNFDEDKKEKFDFIAYKIDICGDIWYI